MNVKWLIRNGRIIDPTGQGSRTADIFIENGIIADPPQNADSDTKVLDASGLIVSPGFIDMHVHFRDPGNIEAESLESGMRAAAEGGFTSVVMMPNTEPAISETTVLESLIERAEHNSNGTRVLMSACLTKDRLGKELSDLALLAKTGAVAFSDDGTTPSDPALMTEAAKICRKLNLAILDHALDKTMSSEGVMHKGAVAEKMSFPGIPEEAETLMVKRDVEICHKTGCRFHIQHISAGKSVDLIRKARKEGLPISAEATPHHIALTDEDITRNDANFKMNPPLRTAKDRSAIRDGILDGTISAFATDHAPHTYSDKQLGFLSAPFGVVGLETAIGVTFTTMVKNAKMSLEDWVLRWTAGPAAILGLKTPSLTKGRNADITIIDPSAEWIVNSSLFVSRSSNTPFNGHKLIGQPVCVFRNGVLLDRQKTLLTNRVSQ